MSQCHSDGSRLAGRGWNYVNNAKFFTTSEMVARTHSYVEHDEVVGLSYPRRRRFGKRNFQLSKMKFGRHFAVQAMPGVRWNINIKRQQHKGAPRDFTRDYHTGMHVFRCCSSTCAVRVFWSVFKRNETQFLISAFRIQHRARLGLVRRYLGYVVIGASCFFFRWGLGRRFNMKRNVH